MVDGIFLESTGELISFGFSNRSVRSLGRNHGIGYSSTGHLLIPETRCRDKTAEVFEGMKIYWNPFIVNAEQMSSRLVRWGADQTAVLNATYEATFTTMLLVRQPMSTVVFIITVVVEACAISASDTLINYFDWIIRDVDVHGARCSRCIELLLKGISSIVTDWMPMMNTDTKRVGGTDRTVTMRATRELGVFWVQRLVRTRAWAPRRTSICGRHRTAACLPPPRPRLAAAFLSNECSFSAQSITTLVRRRPSTAIDTGPQLCTVVGRPPPSWTAPFEPLVHHSDLRQDILKYIQYEYIRREAEPLACGLLWWPATHSARCR